jgi:hypothetical protein
MACSGTALLYFAWVSQLISYFQILRLKFCIITHFSHAWEILHCTPAGNASWRVHYGYCMLLSLCKKHIIPTHKHFWYFTSDHTVSIDCCCVQYKVIIYTITWFLNLLLINIPIFNSTYKNIKAVANMQTLASSTLQHRHSYLLEYGVIFYEK